MMTTATRPRLALQCEGHGRNPGPRHCNLCDGTFTPKSPFERFCPECRETNELLRFVHWLPEANELVRSRMPA